MARIFQNEFVSQINTRQFANYLKQRMKRRVDGSFFRSKREFLRAFYKHPVTIEISGGVEAENISGTNSGYGNLYTYLGFTESPINEELKQILLKSITMDAGMVVKENDGFVVIYTIYVNVGEIYESTKGKLSWAESLSWIEAVQDGLINLGYYLYKDSPNSRSGKGIQAKKPIRNKEFKPRPYIDEIAKFFIEMYGKIKII